MLNIENHIILDNIDSWPQQVQILIKNSENTLKGFLQEEHRIEKLKRDIPSLRYKIINNVYLDKWTKIIEILEIELLKHSIIGFHCTKLMNYEIENVKKNGLIPLNKKFANQRVEALFKNNFISQELRNELFNKEEVSCNNRNGKIFVFHCLATLKDESGLNRLFGYWGGESLYAYLNNPYELKEIGESCIIVTSVKIK